ncbi:hypothetical protein AA12717_1694 [Gluconacetobacter sacchari DSM 12717]|uniref:2TM domain-containing protein n=2 Tax=Gluconacetobacter sacchari TaxID=92759 RepID=A0A7W4NSI3_9PROT|nr:hypothetical protein [Gluconacetobacter sacchari]MBB2161205.1 hypothetical protein [Gluconacetobacter sacchari]GBQ24112.1 hypothetical protein AA12717_1694 [Gluconacetobacter sacchari DSM 12717]
MVDERMAARAAAYDAEFGTLEAEHRLKKVVAYVIAIICAVIAGVAIGRWWHPVFAFWIGCVSWGMVVEARRDVARDIERRRMHGID